MDGRPSEGCSKRCQSFAPPFTPQDQCSCFFFFFLKMCFQLHLIHRVSSSWFHLICNRWLVIIKLHYIDVSLETVGGRSDWNISDMQRVFFLWMFVFFCKSIKLTCEMCLCCLPVELMPGNIFLGLKLIHPNRSIQEPLLWRKYLMTQL